MRSSFLILTITVLISCNAHKEDKTTNNSPATVHVNAAPDCSIALKFINDYTAFISSAQSAKDTAWIQRNTLLTNNFKASYKNLLDSAWKKDPEMGLDFDPIVDGQDFPGKGFELMNCDSTTAYVTVKGKEKEWKDFALVLKLVSQNDQWLVDGSGVINIPADKRSKR